MKIAFVGCGAFCSGTHIPNAAKNPHFQIVAFCDLNEEHLKKLEQSYHPEYVTRDMQRVFQDPRVEMVICGTKPDSRLEVMRLAVKYRKHLFVEKPLCYRNEEIPEMIALMKDAPILFMVGFNRPYSPIMQAVKPILQNNRRGNTTMVYRIVGEGDLWPPSHKAAVYDRQESTIIHEVTHIFDLLNWLTEMRPQRVYTVGGGNTDNVIVLDYPQDITATIIAGDNSTVGYPKERLEINTNFSCILAEEFIELYAVNVKEGMVRRTFPFKQGDHTYDTGIRDAIDRYRDWRRSVTDQEKAYGYYYDRMVRPDKGHAGELEHFRQTILSGASSQSDVIRGALPNVIAESAMESWRRKQAIDIDYRLIGS